MNHSDQQRQLIRTIVSGCLLVVIFFYLASPRLVLKTLPDWFPSDSTEIRMIQEATQRLTTRQTSVDSSSTAADVVGLESLAAERRNGPISWSVAGFPFDAIHRQTAQSSTVYQFNKLAFSLDLLAFCLFVGGGVLFAYHYPSPIHHRAPITMIYAVWLTVFALGAGWHFRQSNARMTDLARVGKLTCVETVQHAAFQCLPKSLRQPWTHLYCFKEWPFQYRDRFGPRSTNPSIRSKPSDRRSLADGLARHPSVQAIALEGRLSPSLQQTLGSFGFLHTFHWNGVSDSKTVAALLDETRSLKALRISFARNQQRSAEGKLDFRTLRHLQSLWISGVNHSEIAADGLKHPRLEQLSLEFTGDNGVPVVVAGLPRLQSLQIAAARSARSNVAIEVRHVPELQTLMVPVFRPVDLQAENVPKLKAITTTFGMRYDLEMRSADFAPWFTSLDIQDAASLRELALTTVKTFRWNVQGCRNLRRLELSQPSQRRRSLLMWSRLGGMMSVSDTANATNEDLEPVWNWLQKDLPLNEISLEQMDLRKVDLASWNRMKFLKSISLSRCTTNPGQMKQLTSISSLIKIRATEVKVDDETVNRLLTSRQSWENLDFDWSGVEQIRIVDQPQLRSAFGSRPLDATSVQLVNLPRFAARFQFRRKVKDLVIENAPGITSLVFSGRFPENAKLSGVTGLRELHARGAVLNEDHYNALAKATDLQTLLLPDCRVPRDVVFNLPQWKRLLAIDVTNLKVNDESSQSRPICDEDCKKWGTLDALVFLNLDHSQVGVETIRQLSFCSRLQALSMVDCVATGEELAPLVRLKSLMELRVGDLSATPPELNDAITGWGEGDFQETFANVLGARHFVSRNHRGSFHNLLPKPRNFDVREPLGSARSVDPSGPSPAHIKFKPSPNRDRRLAAQRPNRPGDAPTNTSPR